MRIERFSIFVFFFVSGFNFAAWTCRIPTLQTLLHLNDAALGTLLAALPLGLMVTMPIAGVVLSKTSSRVVMITSALTYTLILPLLGWVQSPWTAAVILFLFGASRNFFNIAVNTQAVILQSRATNSILTSFHGVWSVAALTGAGLGSFMISKGVSMQLHFYLVTTISLLLILCFAKTTVADHMEAKQHTVGFAWPNKSLISLGFIGFISMVCEGTMSDWCAIYFAKVVKAPTALSTIGYVIYLSAMVLGRFTGDFLVNRFGAITMLKISAVLITTGFATAIVFPMTYSAAMGFVCIGFGVSCIMPLIFKLSAKHSTLPTGTSVAAISTISYLGFLTGPAIVGYIAHYWNLKISFAFVALVAACILPIVHKLLLQKKP